MEPVVITVHDTGSEVLRRQGFEGVVGRLGVTLRIYHTPTTLSGAFLSSAVVAHGVIAPIVKETAGHVRISGKDLQSDSDICGLLLGGMFFAPHVVPRLLLTNLVSDFLLHGLSASLDR